MKIPLGHKLKILKKIREINSEQSSKNTNQTSYASVSSISKNMPRKSALKNTAVTAHFS